jgi:hypothetical protein
MKEKEKKFDIIEDAVKKEIEFLEENNLNYKDYSLERIKATISENNKSIVVSDLALISRINQILLIKGIN